MANAVIHARLHLASIVERVLLIREPDGTWCWRRDGRGRANRRWFRDAAEALHAAHDRFVIRYGGLRDWCAAPVRIVVIAPATVPLAAQEPPR